MSGGQLAILAVLALVVGLAAGVPTGRWQLRRERNQGSVLAVLSGGLGAVLLFRWLTATPFRSLRSCSPSACRPRS